MRDDDFTRKYFPITMSNKEVAEQMMVALREARSREAHEKEMAKKEKEQKIKSFPGKPGRPEGKIMTYKKEIFAREYVLDLNAYAAGKRAGFSSWYCKHICPKWVTKKKIDSDDHLVWDFVDKLIKARKRRLKMKSDDVLKDLQDLKESCMRSMIMIDKKVKSGQYIKPVDATNAKGTLELIGKHLGMWKDGKQTIVLELKKLKDDELDEAIKDEQYKLKK